MSRRSFGDSPSSPGGWTLEAAENVAAQGDGVADVLDGLAALADKSLIRALPYAAEDEPRFDMLETIRDYALEQLRTTGEVKLIRRRHAAYFLELAERIEPALLGAQQRQLDVLEREHDNLRSALHWAADTGEVSVELRLATALAYLAYARPPHRGPPPGWRQPSSGVPPPPAREPGRSTVRDASDVARGL